MVLLNDLTRRPTLDDPEERRVLYVLHKQSGFIGLI